MTRPEKVFKDGDLVITLTEQEDIVGAGVVGCITQIEHAHFDKEWHYRKRFPGESTCWYGSLSGEMNFKIKKYRGTKWK